jgi:hypothetical protein
MSFIGRVAAELLPELTWHRSATHDREYGDVEVGTVTDMVVIRVAGTDQHVILTREAWRRHVAAVMADGYQLPPA